MDGKVIQSERWDVSNRLAAGWVGSVGRVADKIVDVYVMVSELLNPVQSHKVENVARKHNLLVSKILDTDAAFIIVRMNSVNMVIKQKHSSQVLKNSVALMHCLRPK